MVLLIRRILTPEIVFPDQEYRLFQGTEVPEQGLQVLQEVGSSGTKSQPTGNQGSGCSAPSLGDPGPGDPVMTIVASSGGGEKPTSPMAGGLAIQEI